ncbi:hypothetical protein FIBSPDRAFT_723691, partial [Athelia psychrophila]
MINPIVSAIVGRLQVFPSVFSPTVCTNINACRTFTQIIQPAVTALIAANYLSVHMNVPRPMLPWYWKMYGAAKIFLVALMFPDWIFIWALKSFILTRVLNKSFEEYTIVHAFYVLMGGVHVHAADGTPMFPLDLDATVMLIEKGRILLPRQEMIEGLSKTTYLGQSFAAFELGVFLLKCVLRLVEGLPLANFEVMAFAHASIAIFTFIPWWYKPMALDQPTRV